MHSKRLAALGAIGLLALSSQALAQFVPGDKNDKISPADIDKAIEARLKKAGATPGAAGAVPPPGPFTAGGAPGAPGAPGMPGVPGQPVIPMDPISQAMSNGTRFVGCINHKAYFVKKAGGKVTFDPAVQSKATRERIIPSCR